MWIILESFSFLSKGFVLSCKMILIFSIQVFLFWVLSQTFKTRWVSRINNEFHIWMASLKVRVHPINPEVPVQCSANRVFSPINSSWHLGSTCISACFITLPWCKSFTHSEMDFECFLCMPVSGNRFYMCVCVKIQFCFLSSFGSFSLSLFKPNLCLLLRSTRELSTVF